MKIQQSKQVSRLFVSLILPLICLPSWARGDDLCMKARQYQLLDLQAETRINKLRNKQAEDSLFKVGATLMDPELRALKQRLESASVEYELETAKIEENKARVNRDSEFKIEQIKRGVKHPIGYNIYC